jgi:hypothetical protein
LKREEAVSLVKELLDSCLGIDGHPVEITPPNPAAANVQGYQIIVRGAIDEATKKQIQETAAKHQLSIQIGNFWRTKRTMNKSEPDILIIYKPKNH